ncbi:hypothetical protein D3C73_393180 [compost metagenome]
MSSKLVNYARFWVPPEAVIMPISKAKFKGIKELIKSVYTKYEGDYGYRQTQLFFLQDHTNGCIKEGFTTHTGNELTFSHPSL